MEEIAEGFTHLRLARSRNKIGRRMATGVLVIETVRKDIYSMSLCLPIYFEFQGPAWWSFMTERGQAGTTASDKLAASRHACCERRTASDLLCAGLMNQEYFVCNQARSVANRPVFVSPVATFLGRAAVARICNLL